MNRNSNLPDIPYKGLMSYTEEDAELFFGREAEEEIITNNLLASRLTLLYGESGVGKSSVLRAGVGHDLRQLAQQNLAEYGFPEFVVVVFNSWQDEPLANLIHHVQNSVTQVLDGASPETVPNSESLVETLQAYTARINGKLLIILDQFEEYFLYHPQEVGDGTFALEFSRAVNDPALRANFLISIREDSLAKLDRFKRYLPNLFDNYLRIEHLDEEAARDAIKKPVEQYYNRRVRATGGNEIRIESELVDAVLAQVETGKVALVEAAGQGTVEPRSTDASMKIWIEAPYLQLVMTHLWQEEMSRNSDVLRVATLYELGGAEKIVKTHLDDVMKNFPEDEREIAARMFHFLVTPGGNRIAHTGATTPTRRTSSTSRLLPRVDRRCY